MKFDSRDLALTGMFAALYVVINIVQTVTVGNPTIYGPIQLRIADFMIALAILFGWPLVGGVTIGCLLTNAYYFIGAPDVVLGPIANLIAASLVLLLRKRRLLACIVGALPVGLIVGGYLWLFFPPPEVFSALPAWAGMIGSLTVSSLIAVAVIGYIVLSILSRPNIIEPLQSRGLKVVDQG
ncbi:QueT transporter family protein [Candidatus Bathyarchaeota archaeon]|nr:QueT transporter family protein [Candidatus Bathyarchaeota archaeon]